MVNLKNLKNVKIKKLSELTKLDCQLGFTAGILLASLGSGILVLFLLPQWYWKLISIVGTVGIAGNLIIALRELIIMRRNLVEAQKIFKEAGPATITQIQDQKGAEYIQ